MCGEINFLKLINQYIVSDVIPSEYDSSQGIGERSPIFEAKAPIPDGKSYPSGILVRMRFRVVKPMVLATVGCTGVPRS